MKKKDLIVTIYGNDFMMSVLISAIQWDVEYICIIITDSKISVFNVISIDPDQRPRSVTSDLGIQ